MFATSQGLSRLTGFTQVTLCFPCHAVDEADTLGRFRQLGRCDTHMTALCEYHGRFCRDWPALALVEGARFIY
jgi:hypothetical protein